MQKCNDTNSSRRMAFRGAKMFAPEILPITLQNLKVTLGFWSFLCIVYRSELMKTCAIIMILVQIAPMIFKLCQHVKTILKICYNSGGAQENGFFKRSMWQEAVATANITH